MYGKNAVADKRAADQGFRVNNIWHTIQGEGPFAGEPAIFVRLSGCNLRCFFCDTEFEKGEDVPLDRMITLLTNITQETGAKLVVVTGGEPLLQGALPFLTQPLRKERGLRFQIETAGTVFPSGFNAEAGGWGVSIVCSPKTDRVHPLIEVHAEYWKYIIEAGHTSPIDGLPTRSTQRPKKETIIARPPPYARVYVQPCDMGSENPGQILATRANTQEAARVAMKHNYHLSIQMHKIVGLE